MRPRRYGAADQAEVTRLALRRLRRAVGWDADESAGGGDDKGAAVGVLSELLGADGAQAVAADSAEKRRQLDLV